MWLIDRLRQEPFPAFPNMREPFRDCELTHKNFTIFYIKSIQFNLFHQVATHKRINVVVGVQVEPLGEETAKRPYGHLVCCHLTSTASVLHMCTTT